MKLYTEDALITMQRPEMEQSVTTVITSPPYNTCRKNTTDPYNTRYEGFDDSLTDEQYLDWTVGIFEGYDKVLKKDGCVLYNLSYSSENTDLIWKTVAAIIYLTPFTTADCITWKKKSALPNNRSKNKLTRITEFVFVFARKTELKTFNTNKQVVSRIEKTGQANYENLFNFFEAKNNDGLTKINKATFSSEFVEKLMDMYVTQDAVVYDSFSGTGTTASVCKKRDIPFIGSEISEEQNKYAEARVK